MIKQKETITSQPQVKSFDALLVDFDSLMSAPRWSFLYREFKTKLWCNENRPSLWRLDRIRSVSILSHCENNYSYGCNPRWPIGVSTKLPLGGILFVCSQFIVQNMLHLVPGTNSFSLIRPCLMAYTNALNIQIKCGSIHWKSAPVTNPSSESQY